LNDDNLEYFSIKKVFIGCTPKIQETFDNETLTWLLYQVFENAKRWRSLGKTVCNLQIIKFERISMDDLGEGRYKHIVRFIQGDDSEEEIVHYEPINKNEFIGTVYIKENWNGTPNNKATMNDHNIMIYFPDED